MKNGSNEKRKRDRKLHLNPKSFYNYPIQTGRSHALIKTKSGEWYGFGEKGFGQLFFQKLKSINYVSLPCRVETGDEEGGDVMECFSKNGYSTFYMTNKNRLYCSGKNENGQLGTGKAQMKVIVPERIKFFEDNGLDVCLVKCGYTHTIVAAINKDTNEIECYGMGQNKYGQLGMEGINNRLLPEKINIKKIEDEKIVSIETGRNFSIILFSNGFVYSTGDNDNGRLGLGSNLESRSKFTRINHFVDYGIKIKKISVGDTHCLCLSSYGEVYGFGNNRNGLLGLGDSDDRYEPEENKNLKNHVVVEIVATPSNSCFITREGKCFFCGSNISNCLQFLYKDNVFKCLTVPTELKKNDFDVMGYRGGLWFNIFVTSRGEVFSSGENSLGQLGVNKNQQSIEEITKLNIEEVSLYPFEEEKKNEGPRTIVTDRRSNSGDSYGESEEDITSSSEEEEEGEFNSYSRDDQRFNTEKKPIEEKIVTQIGKRPKKIKKKNPIIVRNNKKENENTNQSIVPKKKKDKKVFSAESGKEKGEISIWIVSNPLYKVSVTKLITKDIVNTLNNEGFNVKCNRNMTLENSVFVIKKKNKENFQKDLVVLFLNDEEYKKYNEQIKKIKHLSFTKSVLIVQLLEKNEKMQEMDESLFFEDYQNYSVNKHVSLKVKKHSKKEHYIIFKRETIGKEKINNILQIVLDFARTNEIVREEKS